MCQIAIANEGRDYIHTGGGEGHQIMNMDRNKDITTCHLRCYRGRVCEGSFEGRIRGH
jgi:hypothetical protein